MNKIEKNENNDNTESSQTSQNLLRSAKQSKDDNFEYDFYTPSINKKYLGQNFFTYVKDCLEGKY